MSGFLFYLVVVGCISTVVLGKVSNMLGAAANPAITGKLICAWSLAGYLLAIPCYWIAGYKYKEHLDNEKR